MELSDAKSYSKAGVMFQHDSSKFSKNTRSVHLPAQLQPPPPQNSFTIVLCLPRLMPARPIACRRAVLPLASSATQHIWVSDELLLHTFRRFVRVRGHIHIKHGSNVPGPLEARRRAAKRRMTVAASQQHVASFPISLGALFGFGSPPVEQQMRYEPPSLGVWKDLPNHCALDEWL